MKQKTHHHKTFITLLLLLLMGIGFLMGRNIRVGAELEMITLLVNTIFLVIITHFLLEIYSGNRVLEVVDVTPKQPTKTTSTKKATKTTTKKASKKKSTKKK